MICHFPSFFAELLRDRLRPCDGDDDDDDGDDSVDNSDDTRSRSSPPSLPTTPTLSNGWADDDMERLRKAMVAVRGLLV